MRTDHLTRESLLLDTIIAVYRVGRSHTALSSPSFPLANGGMEELTGLSSYSSVLGSYTNALVGTVPSPPSHTANGGMAQPTGLSSQLP